MVIRAFFKMFLCTTCNKMNYNIHIISNHMPGSILISNRIFFSIYLLRPNFSSIVIKMKWRSRFDSHVLMKCSFCLVNIPSRRCICVFVHVFQLLFFCIIFSVILDWLCVWTGGVQLANDSALFFKISTVKSKNVPHKICCPRALHSTVFV